MKLRTEVDNGMTRRKFFKNTAMTGAAAFAMGAGEMAIPGVSPIRQVDTDIC